MRLRNSSDDDAWQDFREIYDPLIRHWLVRRGVREHDADDVGQDVMQLLVTELANFEHNGRTGALRLLAQASCRKPPKDILAARESPSCSRRWK